MAKTSMNVAIDFGNTCIKVVAFTGLEPVEKITVDYGRELEIGRFCSKFSVDRGICSSVVDLSAEAMAEIDSLPFPVMWLTPGETPVPITIRYATPETLGGDRLAAAVEALGRNPGADSLIIDIGTCITFDYVSSKGEYLGGNISPGITMRLKSLNAFTCRLPLVERRGEMPDIGNSTETAIRSGVARGVKHEVEGYICNFSLKHANGQPYRMYMTGGMHVGLDLPEPLAVTEDDFMVPAGLNRILLYNFPEGGAHETAPHKNEEQ